VERPLTTLMRHSGVPSTTTHEGAAAHNVDGIPGDWKADVGVTGEASSEPVHNVDGSLVEVAVVVLYARTGETAYRYGAEQRPPPTPVKESEAQTRSSTELRGFSSPTTLPETVRTTALGCPSLPFAALCTARITELSTTEGGAGLGAAWRACSDLVRGRSRTDLNRRRRANGLTDQAQTSAVGFAVNVSREGGARPTDSAERARPTRTSRISRGSPTVRIGTISGRCRHNLRSRTPRTLPSSFPPPVLRRV
jgi:hypothetical protein